MESANAEGHPTASCLADACRLIALAGASRAKTASVQTYARYIAYGLFLGCIGDIFLDVEQVKPAAFLPGLVAFLLGHIWCVSGGGSITGWLPCRLAGRRCQCFRQCCPPTR